MKASDLFVECLEEEGIEYSVGGIPRTIDEMQINKMLVLHSPEL